MFTYVCHFIIVSPWLCHVGGRTEAAPLRTLYVKLCIRAYSVAVSTYKGREQFVPEQVQISSHLYVRESQLYPPFRITVVLLIGRDPLYTRFAR